MASQRSQLIIILILYLLLVGGYALSVPLGEGPDEADHYAYARYIGFNRALPEGPAITQSKHPPLYHGLAATASAWTGMDFSFLRSNPDALPLRPESPPNFFVHTTLESFPWRGGALAMMIARLISILFGGVTIWATWQLGREIVPEEQVVSMAAAIFLVGLPGYLVISGVMNNDNAAGAFGALTLLLCSRILRRNFSLWRSISLGLILGLGLLSKVGTLALWPVVAIAALGAIWSQRQDGRVWLRAAGHTVLSWGLGTLLATPWLWRNWRLYGDPLGWELVRSTVDQRLQALSASDLVWLFRGLTTYFWGRFGPIGQVYLPNWIYLLATCASILVLGGAVAYLWGRRRTDPQWAFGGLLLVAAPALVIASIIQYSTLALGTDQARLMWPAIAAIAVWFGLGVAWWARWLQPRMRRSSVTTGFSISMVLLGSLTLVLVVRPAFAPPDPALPPGSVANEKIATFGNSFHLLSVTLPQETLTVGDPVPITLLWQAGQTLPEDLRPVLQLVHQDGWIAASWDHSPAQGRYATDRWHAGEIIADPYLLTPDPAANGVFTVRVGVRPFQGDWLSIEPAPDEDFTPLGTVSFE